MKTNRYLPCTPRQALSLILLVASLWLASIAQAQELRIQAAGVNLAQTHVLNADGNLGPNGATQPRLIGNRDALFKVNFVANKPGIAVSRLTGWLTLFGAQGQTESVALNEPRSLPVLPTQFDDAPATVRHSFDDSHTAFIPGVWLKPGMRWQLNWVVYDEGGSIASSHTKTSEPLVVGPPHKMIMSVIDVQWFGPQPGFQPFPNDLFDEMKQKLPVSDLEVRRSVNNVFRQVAMPSTDSQPPMLVTSEADWVAHHGDGEVLRSNRWASVLQKAAGRLYYEVSNFCVVNHGSVANGGLGSDGYFCSSEADKGIFWHEFGHSLMLRHWGVGTEYPYKDPDDFGVDGSEVNGPINYDTYLGLSTGSRFHKAHVGPYWAFDIRATPGSPGRFIAPWVDGDGDGNPNRWKASPMQGGGSFDSGPDFALAHFSDYSIKKINSRLDDKATWFNADNEWIDDGDWASHGAGWYFTTSNRYNPFVGDGRLRPVDADFDVYSIMIAGSMADNGTADPFVHVYPPIGPYKSNSKTLYSPITQVAQLREAGVCPTGGCDLSVRIVQGGIPKTYALEVDWDTSKPYSDNSSFFETAINLPARDGAVTSVTVLSTPDVANGGFDPAAEHLVEATFRPTAEALVCPSGQAVSLIDLASEHDPVLRSDTLRGVHIACRFLDMSGADLHRATTSFLFEPDASLGNSRIESREQCSGLGNVVTGFAVGPDVSTKSDCLFLRDANLRPSDAGACPADQVLTGFELTYSGDPDDTSPGPSEITQITNICKTLDALEQEKANIISISGFLETETLQCEPGYVMSLATILSGSATHTASAGHFGGLEIQCNWPYVVDGEPTRINSVKGGAFAQSDVETELLLGQAKQYSVFDHQLLQSGTGSSVTLAQCNNPDQRFTGLTLIYDQDQGHYVGAQAICGQITERLSCDNDQKVWQAAAPRMLSHDLHFSEVNIDCAPFDPIDSTLQAGPLVPKRSNFNLHLERTQPLNDVVYPAYEISGTALTSVVGSHTLAECGNGQILEGLSLLYDHRIEGYIEATALCAFNQSFTPVDAPAARSTGDGWTRYCKGEVDVDITYRQPRSSERNLISFVTNLFGGSSDLVHVGTQALHFTSVGRSNYWSRLTRAFEARKDANKHLFQCVNSVVGDGGTPGDNGSCNNLNVWYPGADGVPDDSLDTDFESIFGEHRTLKDYVSASVGPYSEFCRTHRSEAANFYAEIDVSSRNPTGSGCSGWGYQRFFEKEFEFDDICAEPVNHLDSSADYDSYGHGVGRATAQMCGASDLQECIIGDKFLPVSSRSVHNTAHYPTWHDFVTGPEFFPDLKCRGESGELVECANSDGAVNPDLLVDTINHSDAHDWNPDEHYAVVRCNDGDCDPGTLYIRSPYHGRWLKNYGSAWLYQGDDYCAEYATSKEHWQLYKGVSCSVGHAGFLQPFFKSELEDVWPLVLMDAQSEDGNASEPFVIFSCLRGLDSAQMAYAAFNEDAPLPAIGDYTCHTDRDTMSAIAKQYSSFEERFHNLESEAVFAIGQMLAIELATAGTGWIFSTAAELAGLSEDAQIAARAIGRWSVHTGIDGYFFVSGVMALSECDGDVACEAGALLQIGMSSLAMKKAAFETPAVLSNMKTMLRESGNDAIADNIESFMTGVRRGFDETSAAELEAGPTVLGDGEPAETPEVEPRLPEEAAVCTRPIS